MLKPKVKQSKSKSKLRGSDSKMVYFDQSVPLLEKRAAEEALKPTGYHVCQFLDRHVGLLITCHRVSQQCFSPLIFFSFFSFLPLNVSLLFRRSLTSLRYTCLTLQLLYASHVNSCCDDVGFPLPPHNNVIIFYWEKEWEKYGARCTATGSSPTDHTSNISPAGLGPSPLEGDLARCVPKMCVQLTYCPHLDYVFVEAEPCIISSQET